MTPAAAEAVRRATGISRKEDNAAQWKIGWLNTARKYPSETRANNEGWRYNMILTSDDSHITKDQGLGDGLILNADSGRKEGLQFWSPWSSIAKFSNL